MLAPVPLLAKLLTDRQEAKVVYLAAVLAGLSGVRYEAKRDKTDCLARYVVKDGLKVRASGRPCVCDCPVCA